MKKILVVDDDADVAKLLKSKLEAANRYSVVSAVGGRVGVALAQSERPDLVLCDIDMPDLDGGEVANAMATKETTKDTPIIFLSSLISTEEEKKGAKSGRWPVVSKESPVEALIKRIDQTLGIFNT